VCVFLSCVDINAQPRPAILKGLSAYATDETEKQKLLLMASKEGKVCV
jgi:hypothetical protein